MIVLATQLFVRHKKKYLCDSIKYIIGNWGFVLIQMKRILFVVKLQIVDFFLAKTYLYSMEPNPLTLGYQVVMFSTDSFHINQLVLHFFFCKFSATQVMDFRYWFTSFVDWFCGALSLIMIHELWCFSSFSL